MFLQAQVILCYIILPCLISLEAVKIGVSKPLSSTTTIAPNTTMETTVSEGEETELPTTLISSTTRKTTTTTILTTSTTTPEPEWPEFPPRKHPANKTTTTRKPLTTTSKKPKTLTASPTPDVTEITNKTDETPPVTLALSSITSNPNKYCFCDVTKMCDINCCCDPECPADVLKVFKCFTENTRDFVVHEGRFENFKFQHGLPSCELNDGWLCVFRTNIPPPSERKAYSSFSDTSGYYKWPNLLKEDLDMESREFYMYGDVLKLINVETKDIRNFDLPSSLKSPQCHSKEPIVHLKSEKRTCLIPKDKVQLELEEVEQTVLELQDKYKILRKPTTSEDVYNAKQLQDYVANITLRWCNETLNKCLKLNEQHLEYVDHLELNKIQIHIYHNFTDIYGIIIDLWHGDGDEESADESWLIYEVTFLNKTIEMQDVEYFTKLKDYGKITSGPLGYTLGKPLILAKYVPVNKSLPLSEKNQELNYFVNDNRERNIWSLLKKHKGLCQHFDNLEVEEEFISYGINLAKRCKIRMTNETLLAEDPLKANFTVICLNLQDLIHHQLFGHDQNLADISSHFVSQLGKPQNITNKWLGLNVFNADFNPVFGQYFENSGTFICRNILLSLSYEFHIGSFNVDGVAEQNMIKHANLLMGERHDLEFSLDELIEVPLAITVRFYDVNEKAASTSGHSLISLMMYFIHLVIVLYF